MYISYRYKQIDDGYVQLHQTYYSQHATKRNKSGE